MEMIIFVAIFVANAVLCGLQYLTQQVEVAHGRIPTRHSRIPGTPYSFNHWQDAACQTWGDILGLGLATCGFAHVIATGTLAPWQWGTFVVGSLLGSVLWYLVGTAETYKPNWSFPSVGHVSAGGGLHIVYFGLHIGILLTILQCAAQSQLSMLALGTTITGWSIYGLAILRDVMAGHTDGLPTGKKSVALWQLIASGRIRGTIFTFLFVLAGFSRVGRTDWLVAVLAGLCFALLHMCIMSGNDYYDRDHDTAKDKRLAADNPLLFWRYLVGLISCTVLALGFLALAHVPLALFCTGVLILGLVGYSLCERVFVVNNLIVALCGASPMLCGPIYEGQLDAQTLAWYGMFFTLILAREVIKDIDDTELDELVSGKVTFSMMVGRTTAKRVALGVTATTALIVLALKKARWLLIALAGLFYRVSRWDPRSIATPAIISYDVNLAIIVVVFGLV